jgi:hypothetical protein
MSINLNNYAQALIKYDTVHVCRDGSSMIPGRGGGGADLCRSCVPPAINYCSQFTYHHVITQIIVSHFVFIIKNSTPPDQGWGVHTPPLVNPSQVFGGTCWPR